MNIVTRYSHRININDYTTAGIAARLLGINHVTFKTKVLRGEIPWFKSGTDRTEKIYRVKDIVTYAIRNEYPLDKERIERYSPFYQPNTIVDKVYCYCVPDFDSVKEDSRFIECNLRQFIDFLDYDPFNWFCIGQDLGYEYQGVIASEIQGAIKSVDEKQKKFAHTVHLLNYSGHIKEILTMLNNQKGGIRK